MAGTLTIDTLKASSGVLATQNGMTGVAKAWVRFTGTTGVINGSFNISSVTRTGTGAYSVAFTTAMVDSNYTAVSSDSPSAGNTLVLSQMFSTSSYVATAPTTTGFIFLTEYAGTPRDPTYSNVVVFGA